MLAEEAAERAEVIESDAETDFSDGFVCLGKHFSGVFKAHRSEKLMRRLAKGLAERAQEVIRGHTSDARYIV